jgi:hypothetical protein
MKQHKDTRSKYIEPIVIEPNTSVSIVPPVKALPTVKHLHLHLHKHIVRPVKRTIKPKDKRHNTFSKKCMMCNNYKRMSNNQQYCSINCENKYRDYVRERRQAKIQAYKDSLEPVSRGWW